MSYTVLWKPSAESQLVTLWTDSSDRPAVSLAANAIDRLLRMNPTDQGESRDNTIRVMIHEPLGVLFEVHEEDRVVHVLKVWKISRRGGTV